MKRRLYFFAWMVLIAGSCKTEHIPEDVPECIEARITQIQNGKVWNPPAKVFQYTYKGRTVYYIPPRCCDVASVLLDENCTALCSPDGGFTGRGDGRCADFFTERSDERLIWEDSRK